MGRFVFCAGAYLLLGLLLLWRELSGETCGDPDCDQMREEALSEVRRLFEIRPQVLGLLTFILFVAMLPPMELGVKISAWKWTAQVRLRLFVWRSKQKLRRAAHRS